MDAASLRYNRLVAELVSSAPVCSGRDTVGSAIRIIRTGAECTELDFPTVNPELNRIKKDYAIVTKGRISWKVQSA
jgi:hypothetical protein